MLVCVEPGLQFADNVHKLALHRLIDPLLSIGILTVVQRMKALVLLHNTVHLALSFVNI